MPEPTYMIYMDVARQECDIAPDDGPDETCGAVGRNWQVVGWTREKAEQWLAEMLAAGCSRHHDWAPRF